MGPEPERLTRKRNQKEDYIMTFFKKCLIAAGILSLCWLFARLSGKRKGGACHGFSED